MRILIISEYSFPCDHSYLNDVCATIMPRCGHSVYLLMWGAERGVRRWGRATVVMMGKPLRSRRLGALANYINMLRMLCAAWPIVRRRRIGLVQSRADWTTAAVARILAGRFGLRFIYQANYPVEAERLIGGRKGLAGLARRLDVAFHMSTFPAIYRSASAVLPISESYARYFRGCGVSPGKIHPFPMGVSSDLLDRKPGAEETASLRESFGLDGNVTVIGYLGTLHGQRDPGFLAELFAAMLEADDRMRILVVGAEDRGVVLDRSRFTGSAMDGRTTITGWLPRAEALRLLRVFDIGLSIIPPTKIYRISSPTKVVEMMACRVPVVANREIADQAQLVRRSGGGVTCSYSVDSVLSAVLKMLPDPNDRKLMGANGYEYVRRNRSYETMFRNIENLYR